MIALLIGAVLWGIFGRVYSESPAAVAVEENGSWCYLASAAVEGALAHGSVSVNGVSYPLLPENGMSMILIPEDASPRLLKAGNLQAGDLAARVPVDTDLPRGVYGGTVVTEDLKPLSLLIQ